MKVCPLPTSCCPHMNHPGDGDKVDAHYIWEHDERGAAMKVTYSVQEGGGEKLPFKIWNGLREYCLDEPVPRYRTDRWLRICRYTEHEDGTVTRELAVFGMRGDDFVVRWKPFAKGQTLTDVAPMNQYLVLVE